MYIYIYIENRKIKTWGQCFKNRTGRLDREPEDNRSGLVVGSDMLLNRWNRREPEKTGEPAVF
jgi:hypothetical protein